MSEEKMMRLSQVARKLNVGLSTIAEHLSAKGFEIEVNPNSKITTEQFSMLMKEFESSAMDKKEASGLTIGKKHSDNAILQSDPILEKKNKDDEDEIFIKNLTEKAEKKAVQEKETARIEAIPEEDLSKVKLQGIKVVGKIDLNPPKKAKTEVKETPIEAKAEVVDSLPEVAEEAKAAPVIGKEAEPKEQKVEVIEPVAEVKQTLPPVEPTVVAEPAATVIEGRPEDELVGAKAETLKGLTVLGKIELPDKAKKKGPNPVASSDLEADRNKKKKRARIPAPKPSDNTAPSTAPTAAAGQANSRYKGNNNNSNFNNRPRFGAPVVKEEVTDKEIQDKIKATLAKLSGGKSPVNRSKYRKEKRSAVAEANEEKMLQEQEDAKVLKVTEFISANDLAVLLEVSVNDVIRVCLNLGMFVSINQRLDAEAITVIADEFGYGVQFTSSEEEDSLIADDQDEEGDLLDRAPIVTIMGHVDHGKTSLLDYIRKSKVAAGEAGGITQHIGAYSVTTDSGKKITFLDTPGHEAFTAMRARGAKVTDIVIIVVAADDNVMPQTKEAINHAQVAGVPIVIAINKIDKPGANPDKIKEELSKENILVEDWGGKYQCELISAKAGTGITELLEKVLLEAELLELKANPDKKAVGTVVEASLDKGRGYLSTILVQSGTLKVGDVILAGAHFGRVKAMTDHRGTRLKEAGPSTPVQVLGLPGAPQAGDKFNVMDSEREAREIANKREQLLREQSIRTKKHITLDEIGRRLAIGTFKELNVIVKGDVDGSVEALSDSLLKLSTPEVQVRIIHKGVGQISESDVLLASASDAIIIGFQVRPSTGAKKLSEQEQIDIRLYSIIYDAIDQVKAAMEGMLAPKVEEIIVGVVEVREVFKISKIGTIAGCYVTDGVLKRNNNIRLVRDGIVVHTGRIDALKRFKDDVSEVKTMYECGVSIKGFNDIEVGDTIEAFEEKEVKRSL
ncbi:MAG TPA: translation initiation factor IF-2 [Cytophagaceae bacterium]